MLQEIPIKDESLFEQIGGRNTLIKVHKIFYDRLFEHPWVKLYFKEQSQEVLENQQTDFIQGAMGGPRQYCGKFPIPAHKHIFITYELFDLRHQILKESIQEVGLSPELVERWLKIDWAFREAICKTSISECEGRFKTDTIIAFDKP